MCGFVGYKSSSINKNIIKKMNDTIIHRGPDSEGYYTDDKIALGFRRLSIIDITDKASQPMTNEDGNIVIVFNGEIYNYQELKEDLIKNHKFKTNSDTEVLIHGYEEYGLDKLLSKVRGMFAFSIWDKKKDVLYIARDFFGIKPLYYTNNTDDDTFIFGSEIKSFLPHPSFKKELNINALKMYMTYQYSVLDETFFKGVYKLKPGHYIEYKDDKIKIKEYYTFLFKEEKISLKEAKKRIKEGIEESVRYHKISDVEVGSLLSGGIDSSYITAMLKPDNTFTVGFKDQENLFNETDLAKDLSDRLGIKNYKKLITADEFFDILPDIQYHMDEPQSNLSSVPLYYLTKLARKHVTVILSGEGADELFGGYEWYYESKKYKFIKKLPLSIRKLTLKLTSKNSRINKYIKTINDGVENNFIGQAFVFKDDVINDILQPKYNIDMNYKDVTKHYYDKVKNYDDLSKKQYLDMNLWMPGDILLKADKMSMANSVELRVPFLDKEIAKIASSLPSKLRFNGKIAKYALRKTALEVIPKDWANRKKKGFMVPFRNWIKEDKYYELIKKRFKEKYVSEFFKQEELVKMLDEHYYEINNRAREIYTIYTFLTWYKEYFIKR